MKYQDLAKLYEGSQRIERYLERNVFLPDISKGLDVKDTKMVMFMFEDDITVKPKETAVIMPPDDFLVTVHLLLLSSISGCILISVTEI